MCVLTMTQMIIKFAEKKTWNCDSTMFFILTHFKVFSEINFEWNAERQSLKKDAVVIPSTSQTE